MTTHDTTEPTPTVGPETTVVETYDVAGMSCGHCVAAVTAQMSEVAGVVRVSVDVATGTVVVESTQPLDRDAVAAAVEEAGYELVPASGHHARSTR